MSGSGTGIPEPSLRMMTAAIPASSPACSFLLKSRWFEMWAQAWRTAFTWLSRTVSVVMSSPPMAKPARDSADAAWWVEPAWSEFRPAPAMPTRQPPHP